MIYNDDKRLSSIPLNRVAFFKELPALLGVSKIYVYLLVSPPKTQGGDKFRAINFPKPFYTTQSGVRIWWVSDLERWLSDVRRNRQLHYVPRFRSTLLDRPELADYLLGRSL